MSRLDVRTRTRADIRYIDVADFFQNELPGLIASHGHLAESGAREFELSAITFAIQGDCWSLALNETGLEVSTGGRGDVLVTLDREAFQDFVNDLTTLQMLKNLKRLQLDHGSTDELVGWEVVIRALLDRRPVFTGGSIELRDLDGKPLDLRRTFGPGDSEAEMAHFLAEAGFLHLTGWLDEALMEQIAAEMDREFPNATPEDGSWWATFEDGSRRAVRMVDFASRSEGVARLMRDERLRRIGRLTDDGYQLASAIEALIKPLGVKSGISDIPWHTDCTQGMHSYNCCTLVIGISVTGAGEGAGQLAVLPGSHRALLRTNRLYEGSGLDPLLVTTRTGDITVHCSCTLHMAAVPTKYERKVLYTTFGLPQSDEEVASSFDLVRENRDKVHKLTSEIV